MSDRRTCLRCARAIDASARVCPFCNWDQNETSDVHPKPSNASDFYVPPPDDRVRRKVIGMAAFVILVIAAFVVGAIIHGFEPNEVKAAQTRSESSAPTTPSPRASVKLVPVPDSALPTTESPFTTVPPPAPAQPGATTTAQPSDATAMPSDQYTAATARARAARQDTSLIVDPRTIASSVPSRPRPSESHQSSAPQTRPVAIDQPLPHIRVDQPSTARLLLTVGTDGRVHDISVQQAIPDDMGSVISAVQDWRFRPATQNGQPVTARVSVEITFQP
jgi:protein TonB